MAIRTPRSRVERFPQGWAVRRLDGTIQAVVGSNKPDGDELAHQQALAIAEAMLLAPKTGYQTNVNRDLGQPPSVMVSIRRRHRGRAARPDNQYSINVSLQLVLFSHSEASGSRYHRWHKVSLGEMGTITDEAICEAWGRLYGAWAWATHLRMTHRVEEMLRLTVPVNTERFLAMLEFLPAPCTKQQIWEEYGFDPATNTDSKARITEIQKLVG